MTVTRYTLPVVSPTLYLPFAVGYTLTAHICPAPCSLVSSPLRLLLLCHTWFFTAGHRTPLPRLVLRTHTRSIATPHTPPSSRFCGLRPAATPRTARFTPTPSWTLYGSYLWLWFTLLVVPTTTPRFTVANMPPFRIYLHLTAVGLFGWLLTPLLCTLCHVDLHATHTFTL